MASHGAMKEVAAEPHAPKMRAKQLEHIRLEEAQNGGVIATHHFTNYEHKPEPHVFGDGEGHKLAAHVEKHLGISMPGKSNTDKADSEEQESSEKTE
jgi:hypothetical protein